jgi:hypothetical protein
MVAVRGFRGLIVAAAAAVWVLAASGGPPPARASAPAGPRVSTIDVAVFNCDISDEFGLVKPWMVAHAIRASGAGVVGIEEGGGEIPEIAHDLGWPYFDTRMQIVSRLPLVDPPGGNGVYTYVRLPGGGVAALENVHLPSASYGPQLIKKGDSAAQVIAVERRLRLPAILPSLAAAKTLRAEGIPVFLTGDFNSPSYLDWTKATVGIRPWHPFPLRWPVSVAVVAAGFTDSFRAIHPDPVTDPGLTWPTHRTIPGVERFAHAPQDRIDFVYSDGAHPTASRIIGEPGAADTSATVTPWPSDHRLVVSTFQVTGAVPPTMVTVSTRRLIKGAPLAATFFARPGSARSIVVQRLGSGGGATTVATRGLPAGSGSGSVGFATSGWTAGSYQAVLLGLGGAQLSTYPFWVVPLDAKASIATTQASYVVGQPITARIQNGPGDRWDWVAVYARSANDPQTDPYLLWVYDGAMVDGQVTLGRTAIGPWPLPAGTYTLYLLRDDLYIPVASTHFTVH